MRGCIKKRSKDSWTVIVELPRDPITGKRRQKWETVKGTKKDAERALAELIIEIEKGCGCLAPAKMTVEDYFNQYLDVLKNNVRESTLKNYAMAFRTFNQYIGSQPFSKLTPLAVQQAVSKLLETRKQSTVREYLFRLKSAFKQAVAWGLVPRNPADGVKAPKDYRREMSVWTEEEANRFLKATVRHRYHAFFVLALRTGARIGELLALQWSDIDLEKGIIYITKSAGNFGDGSTKTAAGKRKVPIDGDTVRVLKEHRLRQAKERLRRGKEYNPDDHIFCTTKGTRPTYEAMRDSFKKSRL